MIEKVIMYSKMFFDLCLCGFNHHVMMRMDVHKFLFFGNSNASKPSLYIQMDFGNVIGFITIWNKHPRKYLVGPNKNWSPPIFVHYRCLRRVYTRTSLPKDILRIWITNYTHPNDTVFTYSWPRSWGISLLIHALDACFWLLSPHLSVCTHMVFLWSKWFLSLKIRFR